MEVLEAGRVVELESGADRYDRLAAMRLKSARLSAAFSPERLAAALTDVLGSFVSERQIDAWEDGSEPLPSGVMVAARDVMAISEAELIGLENPDVQEVARLQHAVTRVRVLLNDPAALMRRASELLDGTARPLLVLAVVALLGLRAVGGPMTQQYWTGVHGRRATVAAARALDS